MDVPAKGTLIRAWIGKAPGRHQVELVKVLSRTKDGKGMNVAQANPNFLREGKTWVGKTRIELDAVVSIALPA